MPVRLRITLLFAALVMIILGSAFGAVYYFSATARQERMHTRLFNRALTTARLLEQREVFNRALVERIDSLTTLALVRKTVQAYDTGGRLIYRYAEGGSLPVDEALLGRAEEEGIHYFRAGDREAVALAYRGARPMVVVAAATDREGLRTEHNLLRILLLSFGAGTAIVLVSGYIFSARLLQPVVRITADVEEISARNLARRLRTGAPGDEWGALSATLNRLLDRLQESFERQRRFISNASHELSTPLTSISSQIEVALQRDREPEAYRTVLRSVQGDVQQMARLTEALLQFAKASGDPGGLEMDLVRIDEVLLALPGAVSRAHPGYSVTLQFAALPEEEEGLLVFGNEALLGTAIRNIVLNACKYSDDHSASVVLEVEAGSVRITVIDRGRGIPEAELQTIFQPFYRVQEPVAGAGFGLGLSMADRIIRLHKGRIEVASTPGRGSRFDIILPPARALG